MSLGTYRSRLAFLSPCAGSIARVHQIKIRREKMAGALPVKSGGLSSIYSRHLLDVGFDLTAKHRLQRPSRHDA